jgi:Clathrin light chain
LLVSLISHFPYLTYPSIPPPLTNPRLTSYRKWREKRDADLARRDSASAAKKAETIAKARRDIDDFYESYNRKTDKQKAETARQAADFIKNREDTTAGGTSWERIAKLTDLSGKGEGGGGEGSRKKKMREILLGLKIDKDAPGAGGV